MFIFYYLNVDQYFLKWSIPVRNLIDYWIGSKLAYYVTFVKIGTIMENLLNYLLSHAFSLNIASREIECNVQIMYMVAQNFSNAFLLIHKNYWMEISNCYVLCVICLTEVTDNILWSIYIYICRSYKGL